MGKIILSAEELLEDSFRLGKQICDSGYEPTILIALWRGGTPVGMAIQELLSHRGLKVDHIAVRTSSYSAVDQRNPVKIHGLGYVSEKVSSKDKLLIIDDVFDSGNTLFSVLKQLRKNTGDNMPNDVRLAVTWYKPSKNKTDIEPDYYLHQTSEWIVFPHELDALTSDELKLHRPNIYKIIYSKTSNELLKEEDDLI